MRRAWDQNQLTNVLGDVGLFAEILQELRAHVPFSVTSWWRTERHNRLIGGSPHSQHLTGLAADLVPDKADSYPALEINARSFGLTTLHETDHLHVQLNPPRPTEQAS